VTGAAITAIVLLDADMGGEEFGLLVLQARAFELEDTLETLRRGVADLAIEHGASPLGIVTVSVGASLTRITESSRPAHRDGFASADGALYRSKHSGRNRVTMAYSIKPSCGAACSTISDPDDRACHRLASNIGWPVLFRFQPTMHTMRIDCQQRIPNRFSSGAHDKKLCARIAGASTVIRFS